MLESISSPDLANVLTALLVAAVLVLTYLLVRGERRFRRLSAPVYDQIVTQAEKRAKEIVQEATEEARQLKTETERQTGEYLNQRRSQIQDLEQQYEQRLEELAGNMETALSRVAEELSGSTREKLEQVVAKTGEQMEQTATEVGEKLQQRAESLAGSLDSVRDSYIQELRSALSEEVSRANQAVDAYREERLRLVDQEIAGLVERTTQLTLQKKLTSEEHAELVRGALEEARQEGVFGSAETEAAAEAETTTPAADEE